MAKRKFIDIQTIDNVWNGSSYDKMIGDKIWIDPDVIVEVRPLKEDRIYANNDQRRRHSPIKLSKYAYIYRSSMHGHGLNGMSTDMMVDEASYKKICKTLGIA